MNAGMVYPDRNSLSLSSYADCLILCWAKGRIMTEAIFGLIGVAIGAFVSYFAQVRATRIAVEAELRRLPVESRIRDEEKKIDMIREWTAEILALSDPDINANVDYRRIVVYIHRLQLILDTDRNRAHAVLNDGINKLGLLFQTKSATREALYPLLSQIVEAVKHMKDEAQQHLGHVCK
jgi:hypothetical protein